MGDYVERRDGAAAREPAGSAALPPGFDQAQYLSLNPDVATACSGPEEAERHYRDYGEGELRMLLPDGVGIDDPASRLLQESRLRDAWQQELRRRADGTGLEALLQAHPRAAWLRTAFNLASYLVERQDVAAAVENPREAAFHFLEFALEEGFHGRPADWDRTFVRERYGVEPPETAGPVEALALLRAAGLDPLEIALTEAEYWALKGYCGSILQDLFDHEHYHAVAAQRGLAPPDTGRVACIDHFCSVGAAELLPIHADMDFDPAFYREHLSRTVPRYFEAGAETADGDAARALVGSDAALYAQWLGDGLRRGLWPNLTAWAMREFDVAVPPELLALLPVYRLKVAGLPAGASQAEVLGHLLTRPRPGLAALELSSPPLVEFAVRLGDRMALAGDTALAEWLYWLVLDADAQNAQALRHLADLLQRADRTEVAQMLRQRMPENADPGWNSLNLAQIFLQHGRLASAADLLRDMPAGVRADVAMREKARELGRDVFDRIWSGLTDYVAAYGVAQSQAHLRAALDACTPDFTSVERSRPVRRIALVGNDDLYQCKLYRVDQKAEQLRAAGYTVAVFSPARDLDAFRERAGDFDAVIFFRVPAFPPVIEAIATAAQEGLMTFYEIDDLVFDAEHFPPPFESYAGQIDRVHHETMACGVPLFEHAMRLCDYGIASTETIRALMETRVRSGKVFVHRNALGRLHMSAIRMAEAARETRPADAPLVILYGSGTRAHKEDFHEILEPALAQLLRERPGDVEIRLIGHFGTFRHLDPERDPVRIMEPVWDFEDYCALVAEADVNLSVLSHAPLTDAKSEIKWMEAAMFGIPSVVSATAGHREAIADGETGLLCAGTEDFSRAISRLADDPALRRRIGQAARRKVMADYSIEAMGRNLTRIFDTLRPARSARKHRLLVVNVFYPPQAIGGATRVVHDNVMLLRERYGDAYEIDVVCTLEGGQVPYEVTVHSEGGVRVWAITAGQLSSDMAPRDARMADVFSNLVDRISPDLVHFHCIQRLTAACVDVVRYRAIPYLITVHDGWWISPHQFMLDAKDREVLYDYGARQKRDFPERARALYRPLAEAARVLAVSESFAELHRACGVPRVQAVENGVSGLPECSRAPASSGRVRLAHIGGATRHKGIHLVRNALLAGNFANLELLLIDHSLPPSAMRYEVWGTTPVTITGKVPQALISDLYARMDVLLAPSIWPESYGLVTREALGAGAWVVASNRGAIGLDVSEGENGYVVDVSDYTGVLEALRKVEADPDRHRHPPERRPALRGVADQVEDLARIYGDILGRTARA